MGLVGKNAGENNRKRAAKIKALWYDRKYGIIINKSLKDSIINYLNTKNVLPSKEKCVEQLYKKYTEEGYPLVEQKQIERIVCEWYDNNCKKMSIKFLDEDIQKGEDDAQEH